MSKHEVMDDPTLASSGYEADLSHRVETNEVRALADPVVLIVATAFPPDPISGAARPGRFARYLAEFGYRPVVLCQSTKTDDRLSESVRRVPQSAPSARARLLAAMGQFVQRHLLPYNDSLPWAAHALVEAEAELARRSIGVVLSTSPPIGTHLVALWLKLRYGLPWVADFRDPLWGNPFRSRRWFFPYDAMMERLFFRHADALIANTDTVAAMWRQRYPWAQHKITTIYNGFDPECRVEALPLPRAERRVLAHVGSLYGARHPGRLLASMARLIERGELSATDVCVRLVGPIEEQCLQSSRQAVEALKVWGCLEYDGKSVPVTEARRATAQVDYLLLLDQNEFAVDLQIPAKLFEYVQVGRPILAFTRRDSPTDSILKASGVPARVVYQDATDDEVDHEVCSLFRLPSDPSEPSAWFEQQFNGRNQTFALATILNSIRGGLRGPESSAREGKTR